MPAREHFLERKFEHSYSSPFVFFTDMEKDLKILFRQWASISSIGYGFGSFSVVILKFCCHDQADVEPFSQGNDCRYILAISFQQGKKSQVCFS